MREREKKPVCIWSDVLK